MTARLQVRGDGRPGSSAITVLLLFLLSACGGGPEGQVVISGKTVYAGMAVEEVQVWVFQLEEGRWKESASDRSGYHGSFVVKARPGTIRLEARGEIFRNNRKIPLAGRRIALEVPSGIGRMDRIVIELAPVPDEAGMEPSAFGTIRKGGPQGETDKDRQRGDGAQTLGYRGNGT